MPERRRVLPASVRVRLTLWYVFVFGVLLIGFSGVIYLLLARSLADRLDNSLTSAALTAASLFRNEMRENGGYPGLAATEVLNELRLPNANLMVWQGKKVLAASDQLDQPANLIGSLPDDSRQWNGKNGGPTFLSLKGYGHDGARLAALAIDEDGQKYKIAIVSPLHDLAEQLESFRRIIYFGLPATMLVAGLGGFGLARKSLAPVSTMAVQARRIGMENLHERLDVRNPNDELGRLARTFNELLDRLERSFEGMRQFMADASHELRTPLAIIRGEADVALSQPRSPAEYKEALTIVQEEAARLSRLVDDLLALSRADAGQRVLKYEEFYIDDLINEVARGVQVLAEEKGIDLTIDLAQDVAFKGDEDFFRRMVLNLVDNAIKYTPAYGSVQVELRIVREEIRVTVTDNGIGIPPQVADHVFERFYRVDQARSRAAGGSGLGLPIARWIAEAHGGTIKLASEPGVGSTFVISLPVRQSSVKNMVQPAAAMARNDQ